MNQASFDYKNQLFYFVNSLGTELTVFNPKNNSRGTFPSNFKRLLDYVFFDTVGNNIISFYPVWPSVHTLIILDLSNFNSTGIYIDAISKNAYGAAGTFDYISRRLFYTINIDENNKGLAIVDFKTNYTVTYPKILNIPAIDLLVV